MPTSSTSFATGLLLTSVSFSLGVIYGNVPYDYNTLWKAGVSDIDFTNSVNHYKQWGSLPQYIYHLHHFMMALGFIGIFIKLYKPDDSNTLFDGGSLLLIVVSVVVYIANIRVGMNSAIYDTWGDVDQNTGVNVIAASEIMVVFLILGIFGLQFGQFWAEREDRKIRAKFEAEEKAEEKAKKEIDNDNTKVETSAKTTSSSTTSTDTKKKGKKGKK